MSDPVVIDISHYQPDPDFDRVKADGVMGVILKATEGSSYVDDTWLARALDAHSAGLCVATYHFLKHGSISQQMAHYIGETDKVMPPGSRVCIDYEDAACTAQDLLDSVKWLQTNRPDLQIAVYGASKLTDDVEGYSGNLTPLATTSLWAARYSTSQPVIATSVWKNWSLWQYSQEEKVAGINGPVDGNRWNGSDDNLVKWFGPVEPVEEIYTVTIPAGVTEVRLVIER